MLDRHLVRSAVSCLILLAGGAIAGCEAVDMMDDGGFTAIYQSSTFQECSSCHAPGAPGFVDGTETNQDWSTRETAYQSLQGTAAGLIGNFAGCNGVRFLGSTPETSLLVAVFDQDVRAGFSDANFPDCNQDAIADESLRVGALPAATQALLEQWIMDGAPNN